MTGVRSARIENIALPIRGFNTELPPHLLPIEYSPWLVNWDSEGYFFEARKGINYFCETAANYVSGQVAHPRDKTKLIFVDSWNVSKRLVSITVGSPIPTTIGTLAGANATAQVLSFNYERYSYFFYANSRPSIFDGTTFSDMTITGPTAANVIGGCAYKNRLYLFESSSGSLWYSELPRNVQGTFIEFPTTGSIQQSGNIVCAFSVTATNSVQPETFLGVYYDTGEVVLFRGAYPGSADWGVAGIFNVGTPVGTQNFINVEGDIWLLTYGGITSVRQLINGIPANKVTGNISKYWEELIRNVKNRSTTAFTANDPPLSLIRGAYHQGKRKVLISIPGYLSIDTSTRSFVLSYEPAATSFLTYDLETEGWIPSFSFMLETGVDANTSFITPYYWSSQNVMILGSNNTALEAGYSYWDGEDNLSDYGNPDRINYTIELVSAFTKSPYIGKANSTFVTHEGSTTVKRASTVRYLVDYNNSATSFQGISQSTGSEITRDQYNVQAIGNSFAIDFYTGCSGTGYYNLYGIELLKEDGKGIS